MSPVYGSYQIPPPQHSPVAMPLTVSSLPRVSTYGMPSFLIQSNHWGAIWISTLREVTTLQWRSPLTLPESHSAHTIQYSWIYPS